MDNDFYKNIQIRAASKINEFLNTSNDFANYYFKHCEEIVAYCKKRKF